MDEWNAPEPMADTPAPKGENVGYARVSTDDQELRMQLDALERAGCIQIYSEKVSGRKAKRPQLDLAIKELRPGDTLVVWRLDRLARSMRDLYRRLEAIEAAQAKFRSLTEQFDTTTAFGKLYLHIAAAFAQFESDLTQDRTRAGVAARQARGLPHGAPLKFTAKDKARARKLMAETIRVKVKVQSSRARGTKMKQRVYRWVTKPKYTRREIAKMIGISAGTLYLWAKDEGK